MALFNLKSALSKSGDVEPEDVMKTKEALEELGYYDAPEWGITELPDQDLFNAIEAFQKDNDLSVDALMRPGGETEAALDATLTAQDEKKSSFEESSRTEAERKRQKEEPRPEVILADLKSDDTDEEGRGDGKINNDENRKRRAASTTDLLAEAERDDSDGEGRGGVRKQRIKEGPHIRRVDAHGGGGFSDLRTNKDGSKRLHGALDIAVTEHDKIFSPIDGVVKKVGHAYVDEKDEDKVDKRYNTMIIRDKKTGMTMRILYAKPSVKVGDSVKAGDIIGTAQAVSERYKRKEVKNEVTRGSQEGENAGPRTF